MHATCVVHSMQLSPNYIERSLKYAAEIARHVTVAIVDRVIINE